MDPEVWLIPVISLVLFGFAQGDSEKQGLTDLQTQNLLFLPLCKC